MPELKIKYIKFFDYRGFFNGDDDEYLIKLEENNLLIYGENGSGKTSLFRGLKDFVYGNDFITHNQTTRESEGYIEVGFSDDSLDRLEESGNKPTKPEVSNTAKLNSFLSYKELLKTHLFEDKEEINFFDLLVNGILEHHNIDSFGDLKTAWSDLKNLSVKSEEEKVEKALADEEITEEEVEELKDKIPDDIKDKIESFNGELDELVGEINSELSKILDYFNQDLEVKLRLDPILVEEYDQAKIIFDVKLFEESIESHHDFLNEARLSALAISIYLAALKLNPTSDTVKFIFLDDVFLGLDTSNRIPLMNILNNEFDDWQLLVTTYDRHWFEVAKKYLKGNWKQIEMYAGNREENKFETPVIIQDSSDYLERAKKHFDSKDFPACSNYLRKELEKLIKQRLPEEYVRNFEGKPKALSHLWELCIDRYSKLKIHVDEDVKSMFNLTRLILLNPLSHDSINYPIYKKELLDAFELVEKVKAHPIVNQIIILTKGTQLEFKHPEQNYTFEFELNQDWRLDIYNGFRCVDYPKCKVVQWQFNDNPFWDFRKSAPLSLKSQTNATSREDKLIKLIENLEKIPILSIDRSMILNNTLIENSWTLKSYFDRIEATDNTTLYFINEIWASAKSALKRIF